MKRTDINIRRILEISLDQLMHYDVANGDEALELIRHVRIQRLAGLIGEEGVW